VTAKVTDSNASPRSTTYSFKVKVPAMSDSDIGAYFASLIFERVNESQEEEVKEVIIPDFK
jgi:hypothetical protein